MVCYTARASHTPLVPNDPILTNHFKLLSYQQIKLPSTRPLTARPFHLTFPIGLSTRSFHSPFPLTLSTRPFHSHFSLAFPLAFPLALSTHRLTALPPLSTALPQLLKCCVCYLTFHSSCLPLDSCTSASSNGVWKCPTCLVCNKVMCMRRVKLRGGILWVFFKIFILFLKNVKNNVAILTRVQALNCRSLSVRH